MTRGEVLSPKVTEEKIELKKPNKDSNPQDEKDEIVSDKTEESERIIKQKK